MMDDLQQQVLAFRDQRNWQQFHNEKDLAISISLEANELLELFQWRSAQEAKQTKLPQMKEELADVLIYSLMMADQMGVDVNQIVTAKLAKNQKKYPVAKSYNRKAKYTDL